MSRINNRKNATSGRFKYASRSLKVIEFIEVAPKRSLKKMLGCAAEGKPFVLTANQSQYRRNIWYSANEIRDICSQVALEAQPNIRRAVAELLNDSPWEIQILGEMTLDRDTTVRATATSRLRKKNPLVHSVMTALRRPGSLGDSASNGKLDIDIPSFGSLKFTQSPPDRPSMRGRLIPRGVKQRRVTSQIPICPGGTEPPNSNLPTANGYGMPLGNPNSSTISEDILQRFTVFTYRQDRLQLNCGTISFRMKVKADSDTGQALDIRVPEGKSHATVLVHASSSVFHIEKPTVPLRVPRDSDSETAIFRVSALDVGKGSVSLLVYDEYHLIGSLEMQLEASQGTNGLELNQHSKVIFVNPASSEPVGQVGFTIQVSQSNVLSRQIDYQLLLSKASEGVLEPFFTSLGQSPEGFAIPDVQSALTRIRTDLDALEKMLGGGADGNDTNSDEILETFSIDLEGAGRQITDDFLSSEVTEFLASLPKSTVVNWAIASKELDAIPWELIYSPTTDRPLIEDIILVRVPTRSGDPLSKSTAKTVSPVQSIALRPSRFVYTLGNDVFVNNNMDDSGYQELMDVVRAAANRYQIDTNFSAVERTPVRIAEYKRLLKDAEIVYLFCHGVNEAGGDTYLQIDEGDLGRLSSYQIRGLHLRKDALVFMNACSSASASFSVAGLTTFGWEFIRSGASIYIGTLAPVTTKLALRFAQAFFDAYLGKNTTLPVAIYEARQICAKEANPLWMLYAVYGDLHRTISQSERSTNDKGDKQ